jgi:hypothetical protein
LDEAGFESCVLKGQGVAELYGSLAHFRQSGDIDVWVRHSDIGCLLRYMQSCGVKSHATIAHVEGNLFPDVSVELHASPAYFKSFHYDSILKDWIHSYHW